MPKPGTNPRGVEYTREALLNLIRAKDTMMVEVNWKKLEVAFNGYQRWVDLWKQEPARNQNLQSFE